MELPEIKSTVTATESQLNLIRVLLCETFVSFVAASKPAAANGPARAVTALARQQWSVSLSQQETRL